MLAAFCFYCVYLPSCRLQFFYSRLDKWLDRSEERRVGKECRFDCDWSSDVCSSDLPSAVSEPTNPLTTLPIVPSPPTANAASFLSAAACFASSILCSPLFVSTASTFHPADSNSFTADLINGLTDRKSVV